VESFGRTSSRARRRDRPPLELPARPLAVSRPGRARRGVLLTCALNAQQRWCRGGADCSRCRFRVGARRRRVSAVSGCADTGAGLRELCGSASFVAVSSHRATASLPASASLTVPRSCAAAPARSTSRSSRAPHAFRRLLPARRAVRCRAALRALQRDRVSVVDAAGGFPSKSSKRRFWTPAASSLAVVRPWAPRSRSLVAVSRVDVDPRIRQGVGPVSRPSPPPPAHPPPPPTPHGRGRASGPDVRLRSGAVSRFFPEGSWTVPSSSAS